MPESHSTYYCLDGVLHMLVCEPVLREPAFLNHFHISGANQTMKHILLVNELKIFH